MSPYEMVFNQKPRKPIIFTAISHKNAQGYCQPNKDSICYNLPLHTHVEDHFHQPQILKFETQVTIIDTEIIPSHHIGIITTILILNIDTEVAHQNIKDTLIKCRQMKKQLQTPQVLMTQEVTNYN